MRENPIVVPEKVMAELDEYVRAVGEGKEKTSFAEMQHIIRRNGGSKDADIIEKGFNGEGGYRGDI